MGSLWRRMDATAMTGTLIRWPTHLDSHGGCGTSVYALWPRRTTEPMIVCAAGLGVHAVLSEEPVGSAAAWHQAFPDLDDDIDVSSRVRLPDRTSAARDHRGNLGSSGS